MSNLENHLGLILDHSDRSITINPFPSENNPFGTLTYIISERLAFISDNTLLELITPEIAEKVKEERWLISRETIDGDTREIDEEIRNHLANEPLLAQALVSIEVKLGHQAVADLRSRLEQLGIEI